MPILAHTHTVAFLCLGPKSLLAVIFILLYNLKPLKKAVMCHTHTFGWLTGVRTLVRMVFIMERCSAGSRWYFMASIR